MPYVRKGKTVYKKVDGIKKVGSSKTTKKAEGYRRVLEGVHHGWKPTGKKSKKK
uniref:Uncharacterized protein n=1 Tax=viral metagenome TaxID=1070528 RepID=A0A6H1ZD90_9ZZZZ